jgi:poly-gamma-glutamate capsule biosynthesis protein CapA/YwtB (metallophosphatase superfamily)
MTKHQDLFLISLLFLLTSIEAFSSDPGSDRNTGSSSVRSVSGTRTITGVGDIMLGSCYPDSRRLPPHDNAYLLLDAVADTLTSSDITFGNLEGSFLDHGEPWKKCRDTSVCYLFRMPERYVSALKTTGFDILSLANNHFGDFGTPGRNKTRKLLDSAGIKYAGLVEHPYTIFRKDSLLYGFVAFSPVSGTVNMNETEKAAALVRMLSDTCDIVIVSFHGGAEGAQYQHLPMRHEIFHGEDRGDVYAFAHKMIDSGADVIFGHGPHVTRAIEVYKERFIVYSMGNFCTFGGINLAGPNGLAPIVKIKVDATGRFISGRIIPVYQDWPGGVKYDYNRRVITKIRELMASDIKDEVISLSPAGAITYN